MAKSPASASAAQEASYYLEPIPLMDVLSINVGLHSADEETMISLLGSPQLPLTTLDQPSRASPAVKALDMADKLASHISVVGIRPAVASAKTAVADAMAAEKQAGHDLDLVLRTQGMQNVRYRKPTSGAVSHRISNHAWGTAIDFNIAGADAPGNTHDTIPRFIAVLLPFFHAAGWYSGIGFHDTMHFEVARETMQKWAADGDLHA